MNFLWFEVSNNKVTMCTCECSSFTFYFFISLLSLILKESGNRWLTCSSAPTLSYSTCSEILQPGT